MGFLYLIWYEVWPLFVSRTSFLLITSSPYTKGCWSCSCCWPFSWWSCCRSETCIWNGWNNGCCIVSLYTAWSGYIRSFGPRKDGTRSWNCESFPWSDCFLSVNSYWTSLWVDDTRVHALLYLHIYHNAIMFLLHMRERRGVCGFLSWVESFWCHAFHLIAVQFSCHILLIFSAVYLLHFDFWLHIYKLNFKNTFSF